jgi:hypothetical protein
MKQVPEPHVSSAEIDVRAYKKGGVTLEESVFLTIYPRYRRELYLKLSLTDFDASSLLCVIVLSFCLLIPHLGDRE